MNRAAHRTSFLYDALGRKSRITQPDGKYVSFVYGSVRTIDRKAWLATGAFETEVTTTETYDGGGHLYSVTEGSGANNGNVTTYYGYDVGDRLITVATPAAEGTQTRTFIYDGRGFLQYEVHPELGVAGGGTTTYSDYDSRGHVGRKISGLTDGAFDLKYTYDPSERLTDVTEPDPASFTTPKARRSVANLQYATSNNPSNCTTGTCDARNGKLLTATRHNYDPLFGDVAVAETYTYQGRAGRVSSRGTTVNSTASFDGATFNYSQTWDDLGGLAALTYPQATGVSAPARTVTNGFTNGLLTSVGSYASSIAYQPNGVIATVTHGSGSTAVTDTWAADPAGMPRPASITTTNASNQTLWTSGTYAYDGAGNIKQIGTTSYVYDNAGRLRNVNDTSFASPSKTTYKFDTFGNYLSTTVNYCGTLANGVKRCGSTSGTPLTLSGTTNHYANITYDDAGNVRADGPHTYTFDSRNMMTRLQTAQSDDHYLYSADDERIGVVSRINGHNRTKWTLRNDANQLLRTFSDDATSGTRAFGWAEDAVWRGAEQVGRETPTTTYAHSIDHLGSLRAVTNAAGFLAGTASFAPFGLGGMNGAGTLQFTGYERDVGVTNGDALDYAHARYFNAKWGRFLSVDPGRNAPSHPQVWNRYAYVDNDPLSHTDPTGKECPPCIEEGINAVGTILALQTPLTYMAAYNEAVMNALFPSPPAPNGSIEPTYAEFAIVAPFAPSAPLSQDAELISTARTAADAAQAGGKTSGAATAFRSPDGKVYTGVSGSGVSPGPATQEALDSVPANQRSPFHAKCSECNAVSSAENAGSPVRGGRAATVNIRKAGHPMHGAPKPPCSTCEFVMNALKIIFLLQ